MAQRILVPLDGSGYSEVALDYLKTTLANLCPEKKVTVVLLHVVCMTTPSFRMSEVTDAFGAPETLAEPHRLETLKEESTAYLTEVAKSLKGPNIEVKKLIVDGTNPAEEIIKAEEETNSDLVVMATHGRSGLSRWAFGSVTDKVLRAGSVPVLLVRTKE